MTCNKADPSTTLPPGEISRLGAARAPALDRSPPAPSYRLSPLASDTAPSAPGSRTPASMTRTADAYSLP